MKGYRTLLDWALGILLVYILLIALMYLGQRNFIYLPDPHKPVPAAFGLPAMDIVSVNTGDGLSLSGWYQEPISKDSSVIVMFHGNAGHQGIRAFKALPFLQKGYGFVFAVYRGYGGNSGKPTEQGLYEDGRAWLNWLIQEKGYSEDQIILYGESLGTGVVFQMALEFPDLKALILEAPFSSFLDLARKHYPFVPNNLLLKDRYENSAKIGKVHIPLLVVHGKRDRIVPYAQGVTVFDLANEPKAMLGLPFAGHNDLYAYGAANEIFLFLDEYKNGKNQRK